MVPDFAVGLKSDPCASCVLRSLLNRYLIAYQLSVVTDIYPATDQLIDLNKFFFVVDLKLKLLKFQT
jgi:hypothetical protein